MKKKACFLSSIALGILSLAAAATNTTDDLDAKIAQLSKKGTTAKDVLRVLGEPESYQWGDKTFTKSNLPASYLIVYPKGVSVFIMNGRVWELRSEKPGPGFTWRGKLRLGSSLEEVLAVLGPPAETVTGEKLAFKPGVLYKDWEGKKGYCYYSRPEQNIRLFFGDYKVTGLYVPLEEDGSGGVTQVPAISEVKEYQDVRFKDLSKLKLAGRPALPQTLTFNQKTLWPTEMPPGAEPSRLLAGAMNPGLGVHKVHQEGLTGKGVNVAIIDQPLYQDHPEFAGKIAAYHDVGCGSGSSMHGPAVASLLVGAKCGTAPEARLYYVATPFWTGDSAYFGKALDWITDQDEKLPAGQKIRVVSVSAAPSGPGSPFKKSKEMWDTACARAEKAGILVLDCTVHHGFLAPCYYDATDPENVSKCRPGVPSRPGMAIRPDRLLVPCSPRTVAEEDVKGDCAFQYYGQGGLSWGIPYAAGVLALGWQARPELTGPQMRELLFASAHVTPEGAKIINPSEFIRMVREFPMASRQRESSVKR
jgi:serine protease AprX